MDNFRQYIKEANLKDDDGYEFELTEDKLKMYFIFLMISILIIY